jgi:HD-like signal output (HDOD) protein
MEHRNHSAHDIPAPHFSTQPSREDLQELLELVQTDEVDFDDIVQKLENRGLISATLIRTANSIGVGSIHQARSLKHALAILGLRRIREVLRALLDDSDKERARIAS